MAKKTTKPATETKPAKTKAAAKLTTAPKPKTAKPPKEKKVSQLDAAAQVLAGAAEPMNCMQMIEAMTKKGLWSSPKGKTPQATLYSAILREINTKGKDARFKKTERGQFKHSGV